MKTSAFTIPALFTVTLIDQGRALPLARPIAAPDVGPGERGVCVGRLKLFITRPEPRGI